MSNKFKDIDIENRKYYSNLIRMFIYLKKRQNVVS